MKTHLNLSHPIPVSLAAFAVMTLNAVATAAVVAATGIAAILLVDYGWQAARFRPVADVVAFGASSAGGDSVRKAA